MQAPSVQDGHADSRRRNLARLLHPRHVAVVGGKAAAEAVRQLDRIGFSGPVWPVNPRRKRIEDRACFASIADLPEAPDAAVVAVPAQACPEIFAALNARGAGGGICFAAGFAEDGESGLERELLAAAGDCALVGPNCHGIINCLDRVALWPDDHGAEPVDHGFALISQSGNVALSTTFQQRSAPLGYVIGTGNQAQLGIEDFIEALLDDSRVHAIGLFVEGLRDVGRFARAARRALEAGVPLVALKVGATEQGARASHSHTAALTGSDEIHAALFRRLGVRRVETPAELIETLKLLCVTGPLAGRRLLSLSCSGGEAALMADLLEDAGLECPAPQDTERVARAFGIPAASVGNPLDYNTRTWGDLDASTDGFETVMGGGYDAAVLVLDFPPADRIPPGNWRTALDAFIEAHGRTRAPAAVLATLPEALPADAREACLATGVTPLQGLAEGIRALAHAAAWSGRRRVLLEEPAWEGPSTAAVTGTVESLDEAASKAALADFGLPVPASRVTNFEGIAAAAGELGFPVLQKALVPDLEHMTEGGGVVLGLESAADVMQAAADMAGRLQVAGHVPRRWLVERMLPGVVAELIVGIVRDPAAGPVLVVGSGGILAELVRDSRSILLPASEVEIRAALDSLVVGRILRGYRGGGGDIEAAVAACAAVARFAREHADRIVELDVNPLLVLGPGQGAVAADAMVRLAAKAAEGSDPDT